MVFSDLGAMSVLKGDVIESLVIRSFDSRIIFESGISILIENKLTLNVEGNQMSIFPNVSGEWSVREILGKRVASLTMEESNLTINLECGASLLLPSASEYESYHIELGNETITV